MTSKEFKRIVRTVRYRQGWRFTSYYDSGLPHGIGLGIVHLDARVSRAQGGGIFGLQWSSQWLMVASLTKRHLEKLILQMIADAEKHEREERLVIDGRRPFNPHGD